MQKLLFQLKTTHVGTSLHLLFPAVFQFKLSQRVAWYVPCDTSIIPADLSVISLQFCHIISNTHMFQAVASPPSCGSFCLKSNSGSNMQGFLLPLQLNRCTCENRTFPILNPTSPTLTPHVEENRH